MCKKLLLLALVLGLVSPAWSVYVMPSVENGSFELPGDGKHNAWSEECNGKGCFTDVPDWESDIGAQDSGVEGPCAWPGVTDGEWAGFLMNAPDGSVYNVVSYRVVSGDQFAVALDARDNWTETPPALLQLTLGYTVAGGARTPIASEVLTLDGSQGTQAVDLCDPENMSWRTYVLNVPDAEMAVGSLLYIELQNVSDVPEKKSWIGVDNVRFVPEPATIALLGFGGLALLRVRKKG